MTSDVELLTIAQAAALLQVSEASLRRWTNRGLLPCLRIGGRRERRFRRADLMAFVEKPSTATTSAHLCALYTSDLGRTRQAARLLGDGLDAGSICFLAAQPDVGERVLAQLGRRRRSPVLTQYADSAAQQLSFWKSKFEAATRDGARAIQVVGDVSGAAFGWGDRFDRVLEYEAAYGEMSRRFPVVTTCLYDARAHSGVQTAGVLALHPDLFRHPVAHLVT